MRQLIVQFAVLAAGLLGLNAVTDRLAANAVPRQLLRRAAEAEPATDLFLGNSLIAAGADEAAFDAARPGRRGLNLGLGATDPVEHLLILNAAAARHPTAAVHYGFFDTQLTDPTAGDFDTLVGNRNLLYLTDFETGLRLYAIGDPAKKFRLRAAGAVPAVVHRQAAWGKVEHLRRRLAGLGRPAADVSRFGRAADFSFLESDPTEFQNRCAAAVADGAPLTPAVAELFARCRAENRRFTVIEMPMPATHRRLFYSAASWAAYRGWLDELVRAAGGNLVPASNWIEDTGFDDPLHLSPAGAKRFTERYAKELGP